jgi:hypothetical protein
VNEQLGLEDIVKFIKENGIGYGLIYLMIAVLIYHFTFNRKSRVKLANLLFKILENSADAIRKYSDLQSAKSANELINSTLSIYKSLFNLQQLTQAIRVSVQMISKDKHNHLYYEMEYEQVPYGGVEKIKDCQRFRLEEQSMKVIEQIIADKGKGIYYADIEKDLGDGDMKENLLSNGVRSTFMIQVPNENKEVVRILSITSNREDFFEDNYMALIRETVSILNKNIRE